MSTSRATWPSQSRWSNLGFTFGDRQIDVSHYLFLSFRVISRNLAVSPLKSGHQSLIDRIIAMHSDGLSNRMIMDQLNSEGVLTPRGKAFTTNHVYSIVKKGLRRGERIGEIGTISNLKVWITEG
jgi:hypothetical protein